MPRGREKDVVGREHLDFARRQDVEILIEVALLGNLVVDQDLYVPHMHSISL